MSNEQKGIVKGEWWGQLSGGALKVNNRSHQGMSMLDEAWTEVEGRDKKANDWKLGEN